MTDRAGRRRLATLAVAVAVGLAGVASRGAAAERVGSALLVYTDTDHVTVYKPMISGETDIGQASLRARWSTDFVSAASVDLLSSASPRGFTEQRNEAQVGAGWEWGDGTRAGAEATVSREPDYKSQSANLQGSIDVLHRRLTLLGGMGLSTSEVGRVGDVQAWRSRVGQDAHFQLSAVLTPWRVVDAIWTVQHQEGYQASLYRYVRLFAGDAALHTTAVAEHTPNQRWRHAGTLRLRQKLSPRVFGQGDYRLYADTWGMAAHSLGLRGTFSPAESWLIEVQLRGHHQTGVAFYRGRYTTSGQDAPAYRSADKELGPMRTALLGTRIEYSVHLSDGHTLRLGLGADLLYMRYLDHPYLAARSAVVSVFDLAWEH